MNQYLPFLTDAQGRSLDVENGVVLPRSVPTPLQHSPEGWDKNTVQFTRNNEFRGVIKSYTTPLKFFLEGATILRNAYYRFGMETVLFFIWLKLDQSFGGNLAHKAWYKGEPAFDTFHDTYDGVEITITEGGFYKDLQANKGVVYEIPFDMDAVSLYNDGLILYTTVKYGLLDVVETLEPLGGSDAGFAIIDQNSIPYNIIAQEGQSYGLEFLPVDTLGYPHDAENTYITTSNNWMVKNGGQTPVTFPLVGHVDIKIIEAHAADITLYFRTSLGTRYFITGPNTPVVTGGEYVFPFSFNITLAPGEKLFSFRQTSGETRFTYEYRETSECIIRAQSQKPATVMLAQRVMTLGDKLVKKMSPGATLGGSLPDWPNLLVISGDAIRGLPGAVIKASFSEWNKSVDAVQCTALNVVDNNPVIGSRYDSYNKDLQIAQLGECSNWQLDPANDYVYDTIEGGYVSKTSDSNIDVNGRYSFNNGFSWKMNITRRNVNAYMCRSGFYADPYDMELIRLNLGGRDTTAGSTDNSNFFIDAEPKTDVSFTGTIHLYASDNRIELDGDVAAITPFIIVGARLTIAGKVWTVKSIVDLDVLDIIFVANELITASLDTTGTVTITNLYQLRRPTFTTTGIPNDGTVYNLMLSPRRIINPHLRWLRSSADHLDGQKFVFQTTEKNKNLVTVDTNGVVVNETADILVAEMGERVYLPNIVSFQVASPFNLYEMMQQNAGGKIDYFRNGVAMDGFPLDIVTENVHLETQTYKLLQTANNDNLTLINGR